MPEVSEGTSKPYEKVLSSREMPGAEWLEGAELNHAGPVFRKARPGEPAVPHRSELRPLGEVTWPELLDKVGALVSLVRFMKLV